MFPVFFYILVLGDLDSNFLYYGQPFWGDGVTGICIFTMAVNHFGGMGDLKLHICDSGQLLNVKWLTGIIFFPKQVILVNKIVD